jgi:hypothetical protein
MLSFVNFKIGICFCSSKRLSASRLQYTSTFKIPDVKAKSISRYMFRQ